MHMTNFKFLTELKIWMRQIGLLLPSCLQARPCSVGGDAPGSTSWALSTTGLQRQRCKSSFYPLCFMMRNSSCIENDHTYQHFKMEDTVDVS